MYVPLCLMLYCISIVILMCVLVAFQHWRRKVREVIKTRFSHYENFEEPPGQIYCMMILNACNAFAATNIEGAEKSFKALTLSNFPGENVSDLATVAHKYIQIMSGAYTLPSQTWCLTSIFNRNILNHYADEDPMRTRYALKYPTLCAADPDYANKVQLEYVDIFKMNKVSYSKMDAGLH